MKGVMKDEAVYKIPMQSDFCIDTYNRNPIIPYCSKHIFGADRSG